jgi:O-antigen/teichoic acid export membrane protein
MERVARIRLSKYGVTEQSERTEGVGLAQANTRSFVDEANRQNATWDLLQAPKNYVALVSAQVTSSLLSFGSVWLATHHLGAGGYGGVVAFITAAQIVMLVTVNWTSLTVARYGCEEFVQTGRIASTFWARLVILFPNLLLVVATTPLWLPILSDALHLPSHAVWLVLSLLLANAGWIHVQRALQGAKLLRLQGWLSALERALIFVAMCSMALSGKTSVWNVGCVYVLGPLGASAVGLFILRPFIWPVGTLDVSLLRRMLRFSLPIIPTAFLGYLSTHYLDALLIAHFLSHVKLGLYAVAYQLTGVTQQLPLLAGYLLMPCFVTLQTDKQESSPERFVHEVLPLLTLFWTLVCAAVAALGWYLLPLLFGPEFDEIRALLWPLMAASAFAGPMLMGYNPIAASTSKTYVTMVGVTFGSCVNLILNWLLIPRFGLVGCAWATTAAYGIALVAVIFTVHGRIVPRRTWTLAATCPIVLGALYASVFAENIGALGLTVMGAAVVAWVHRGVITAAVNTLNQYGRFAFPHGLTRGQVVRP